MSFSFEKTSPESVGIPTQSILSFLDASRNSGIELHSLMVLRYGKVCFEAYWEPYNKSTVHPLFSFSKTLTSTAIGFAVQEGLLSLDTRVAEVFPDKLPPHPSPYLKEMTIEHLLTMSCGHETEPQFEHEYATEEDWIAGFFAHPLKYKPGTMFCYNSWGTSILAAALRRISGQNLIEYLRPRLLEPLGIETIKCMVLSDGTDFGGGGIRLRTEDMAKFIQFVLNRGNWQGRQLLNAAWFARAAAPLVETAGGLFRGVEDFGCGYGYQFWRCTYPNTFRADGAHGQFGVVVPDKKLAVIITEASHSPQQTLRNLWATLLKDVSDVPLAENPAAQEALGFRCAHLTVAQLTARRNPAREAQISGKTFVCTGDGAPGLSPLACGAGWFGRQPDTRLHSLSISFDAAAARLTLTEYGASYTIAVGLEGSYCVTSTSAGDYAAIGSWRSARIFDIELRRTESIGGAHLSLLFTEDGLEMNRAITFPYDFGYNETDGGRYFFNAAAV